ncbi:MAG TPA: hypothetical protein VKU00_31280 [Chthonomonadaceae bacterium]|nr:hypothetical protein [Chthonomonadaceae bacterium]
MMKFQRLQTSVIATPGTAATFIRDTLSFDTLLAFVGVGIKARFAVQLKCLALRFAITIRIGKLNAATEAVRDISLGNQYITRIVLSEWRTLQTKMTIAQVARLSIDSCP